MTDEVIVNAVAEAKQELAELGAWFEDFGRRQQLREQYTIRVAYLQGFLSDKAEAPVAEPEPEAVEEPKKPATRKPRAQKKA